jgi:2-C-methyl-D-erythritol 4-phosphate cytidylyltransferase
MTSWTAVVLGGRDPLLAGLEIDGLNLSDRAACVAGELGLPLAASLAEAVARGGPIVVLDAHCPLVAADDVRRVQEAGRAGPAVGVRPVTDTVKRVRHTPGVDLLGETVDREALVALTAPLTVPDGSVLAGLETAADDVAWLAAALRRRTEVTLVEVSPAARRVRDGSDLELLSAG